MEQDRLMDYYVLLTGGKNNAGDFLIKHRAKNLLKEYREDRELVDLNAWEPLEGEKLDLVNKSKALLLTGGPALSHYINRGVYELNEDLNKIKVPIITFGLGWNSETGNWKDVNDYSFSKKSIDLLNRISKSGFFNSVRDYHTYQVLKNNNVDKVLMTGCPALYEPNCFNKEVKLSKINRINFSLGVSFAKSKKMERSVKELIMKLSERFGNEKIKVMFHHSLDENYLSTPNPRIKLYKENVEFSKWLSSKNIEYKDISGSANDLISEYEAADLHAGYRVHAHIFMSSISKPSVLISEDGRGKALGDFLSGCIFDGFTSRKSGIAYKALNRVFNYDLFSVDKELNKKIIDNLEFEIENKLPRIKTSRVVINNHFSVMKKFINQLP